eukprot:CAMPEP_0180416946 /NCGR_PEP_ID=MMETSP1036_2-20121128/762_1 /TAXON_ID=632150 /ORGANISM="Azadinium spinosum, Strain 3D9" /LENGTH=156 /DNA_ID=CAMNT_0022421925 /DNA_START=85 /DNA_END=552 /DNA_ORIENTATION=+
MLVMAHDPDAQVGSVMGRVPGPRLQDIELMRVLMCLVVVVGHLYEHRNASALLRHKEHFVWNFVMISGFVTHKVHGSALAWNSAQGVLSFYHQRLLRVLLSYHVACAVSFAVLLEKWSASGIVELWGRTWWTFAVLQSWAVPFTRSPVQALNLPLW